MNSTKQEYVHTHPDELTATLKRLDKRWDLRLDNIFLCYSPHDYRFTLVY